jgi:tetratricopeptide (TPR) repeat protein
MQASNTSIEQLVEEFTARLKAGENPSIDQYCADHPGLAEQIRDLFPTLLALEQAGTANTALHQMDQLEFVVGGDGGQCFGDFRIVREIGRGGMGVVYEAVQESLGRRVALKVLAAEFTASPTDRERFRREAEAAGKLYHTNIVPVFGVGMHGLLHYYVMQYIDGTGLDEHDSLSVREVAEVGLQAANALEHAHTHGVIHRDIKPSNLLMDRDGRVWVADFGLARHEGAEAVTMAGQTVGTLRYMAPEQFHGNADARSDIHSLGLTLHELLASSPAFPQTGHGELARIKTTTEPPLLKNVPRDLATIVRKACALDPVHRYQSVAEMANDLRRFLENRPVHARKVGLLEYGWRWSRRNPAVSLLGVAAVLLLLAVAAVSATGYFQTTRALRRAEANLSLALDAFEQIMDDTAARGVPRSLSLDIGAEGGAPVSPADARLLESLLVFFDRFASQNQADLQEETAEAYCRIGEIHDRLGNHAEAERVWLAALETGALDPLQAARMLNKLGRGEEALVLLEGSNEPEILLEKARILQTGLQTDGMMGAMRKRRAGNPANGLRARRTNTENDVEPFEEALSILQMLCETHPHDATYRLELAHCQRNHMLLALKEGDASEAKQQLDAVIRGFEELVEEFPDQPRCQYGLADTLCLQLPGRRGVAPVPEAQAQRAVEISERLHSTYPWMPSYQAVLATALARLADARLDDGKTAEAERDFSRSANLFQALDSDTYRLAQAKSLLGLGDALRVQGRLDESAVVLEKSMALVATQGGTRSPSSRGLTSRLEASLDATRAKQNAR